MRKTLATAVTATLLTLAAGSAAAPAFAAPGDATVDVFHGVPGLTVDVYAGDDKVISNFRPGSFSAPLSLPAGSYDLAVRPAGAAASSAPAVEATVEVTSGEAYTVAAHLSAGGTPELTAFADDLSPVAADQGRLSVRHTAAAPAVDVLAGDTVLAPGLTNPDAATLATAAGTVSARVNLAGTSTTAIGPADLTVGDGRLTTVYAWGSAADDNLALAVKSYPLAGPDGVPAGEGPADAGVGAGTWGLGAAGLALAAAAAVSAAHRRRAVAVAADREATR